jgi:hypothetical protein
LCQPRAFLAALRHDRFLDLTVDLGLRPLGSPHKAIQTRELQ